VQGLLASGRLLKQNSSLLPEEVGSTVSDPGEIDLEIHSLRKRQPRLFTLPFTDLVRPQKGKMNEEG
jgi:hypothetical protein